MPQIKMKRIAFLILGLCCILSSAAQTPQRNKTDDNGGNSGAALSVRRARNTSSTKTSTTKASGKDTKSKAATTTKAVTPKTATATSATNAAATATKTAAGANDSVKPRFVPRRQVAQQTAKPQEDRAQLEFPTATEMPNDVVWRRDIYRTLDLTKDANATLYYPLEQQGDQINLFTYLFKLILRGDVKAYDYSLNGSENFDAANQVKAKDLMDRYHIYYETKDGRMRVTDNDLPAAEVLEYFIKESSYYDQRTSSYNTKVVALCPVLKRADDFSGGTTTYPMFWVKYSDISPFLTKLPLTGSNYNNAANMSADDYFAMNCYDGKIYKTNNLQGKVLANYCPTDSAMTKEQNRIEKQLADFEQHIWGEDSLSRAAKDSVSATAAKQTTTERKRRTLSSRRSSSSSKASETKSSKGSGTSSPARVSVRRERH